MLRFFVQCLATLDTCIANPDSSSKSIADATECRSTVIIGVKQARNAEDYLETRVAHVRQAVTAENENIAHLYALLHERRTRTLPTSTLSYMSWTRALRLRGFVLVLVRFRFVHFSGFKTSNQRNQK